MGEGLPLQHDLHVSFVSVQINNMPTGFQMNNFASMCVIII